MKAQQLIKKIVFLFIVSFLPLIGEVLPTPNASQPMMEQNHQKIFKKKTEQNFPIIRATSTDDATASPIPDPAFSGWWKLKTREGLGGFGFRPYTGDVDAYIFIDTSAFDPISNPIVTINTFAGNPKELRVLTNVDGQITFGNLYYVPDSMDLVNIFAYGGPDFNPAYAFSSAWSLALQDDKKTICASDGSLPGYNYSPPDGAIFEKVSAPDLPIRPLSAPINAAFPDVNDPVVMAKYIYESLLYNFNPDQNVHLKDEDYRSYEERKKLADKLFNEGITFETPIRKVRVSQPGLHTNNFVGPEFTSTDLLTDIFTDGYPYAFMGATVEISGFKGKWAALNGVHVNGVAIAEEGGVPNPRRKFIDINGSKKHPKGTYRNTNNKFLLAFDTSNPTLFPRNELGEGTQAKGKPVVKVTYKFTSDMEYPAFAAAIRAMGYILYQTGAHFGQQVFFPRNSMTLFNTWSDLQQAIATNNFWGTGNNETNFIYGRENQAAPSGFYNNPTTVGGTPTRVNSVAYNDPFGLTQLPGSVTDYNIDLANYIVNPKNLYFAIAGSPNGPQQFDPSVHGYKPLIPGPQNAEFVGALGDVVVTNGIPQPQFPAVDPTGTYYSLLGPYDDVTNSNSYYIGLIDPSLTKGKKIGYFRLVDTLMLDPGGLILTSIFAPKIPPVPNIATQANIKVLSQVTRYFQTDENCQALIIDMRANAGGAGITSLALANLVGGDRYAYRPWNTEKDKGFSPLINLADSTKYRFYNNLMELGAKAVEKITVSQNAANYGEEVIFRGSHKHPKKIIFLIDWASYSAGDAFPHNFLGDRLDGDIGSHTQVVFIGDIDGRFKGSPNEIPVPVDQSYSYLRDPDGNPVAPITLLADFGEVTENGQTQIFYNQQLSAFAPIKSPTRRGKANGKPLANDWKVTVWKDLGLFRGKGYYSRRIPKQKPVFRNRSTWRDSWLEQAILEAID